MKRHEFTDADQADLTTALTAADVQASPDAVVVRSDVWPRADGSCDWAMSIPGTDFAAEGKAACPNDCFAAIDAQLAEWFPKELASQDGESFLVARIVP